MAYPKISTLSIGILIVGLIVFGISQLWVNLDADYTGLTADSDDMALFNTTLNQINNISSEMNQTLDAVEDAQEPQNALDKIGGLASNLWSGIKVTFSSGEVVFTMINSGIGMLGLGPISGYLRVALITMVVISMVFVFLYLIFKVKT